MVSQSIATPRQAAPAHLTQHRTPLPALTGIRFFAAMQVLFFHFGAGFAERHRAPAPIVTFLSNGWSAVTLFFLLSGFILSYTYVGQIEKQGGKRRFWEARFARIYPVYFLSLVLNWPFRGALSPGLAVGVLGMVQAWNPLRVADAGAWNLTAWTLSTEAFFYVLFPFVLPLVEKLSTRALRVFAVVVIFLVVLGHTMSLHYMEPIATLTFIPLPAFRFPEFLTGMILGLLFLRRERRTHHPWKLYTAALTIMAILAFIDGPWISVLFIPLAVLIYELALGGSILARLFGSKSLLLLGGASYAIYLLQLPIRNWLHLFLVGAANDKGGIDAIVSPVVLVIFSIGVFLFWEEPARKWLRNRFKKLEAMRYAKPS